MSKWRSSGSKKPPNASGKGRALKVNVRTAKGRRSSSARWLERQLNDPYVAAAKREGLRSRAAFKLIEIDAAHGLLKPGQLVVDLGAAPGGWSQVAAKRAGAEHGIGRVIAVDLVPMDPLAGVELLQFDFTTGENFDSLEAALDGAGADVVLSDMATPSTGHRQTDHLRIMALCEQALDFALAFLNPGGAFLSKVLQGGTEQQLLGTMKKRFERVRHVKPEASRQRSAELYVLAQGFRGSRV